LLKEVGPITVPLLPKLPPPPKHIPVAAQQPAAKPAPQAEKGGKGSKGSGGGSGSRKGAQNIPDNVIEAVTKGKRKTAAPETDSGEGSKKKRQSVSYSGETNDRPACYSDDRRL
jgi:hypothetical protein